MLLEYNQDTNELELKEKAIELRRRVAGRKLEQSLSEGVLDADGVLQLSLVNRKERQTHMQETVEIVNASVKERIALNRADQHLVAVGQVKTLERDIARASRLGKARFDALDDLERRVKQMRSLLHNPTFPTVDAAISTELLANPKLVKLEKHFQQCPICDRRILVHLLEAHTRMCSTTKAEKESGKEPEKEKLKHVYHVDDTLITSLATFKPHPPRNFRVIGKGISFIDWQWDPPVIDGGLEITEYEISYQVKHSEFDFKNNKYIKWEEENIITTSNWLFRENPVCHKGFKMCNLRANSEYSHFKIRAFNIRGWSEWEKMQENEQDKIIMDKEIPPTQPLFVTCDLITSTCLHLSWSPPFFDGGLPVIEYIVCYTVVEILHTVTDRAKKVEKHLSYSTESPIPNTIIRNLPDNTDIVNIYVCAKNQARLVGAKGLCQQKVCKTKKCSRYTQLRRELDISMSSNNPWIDSDFFTGVKQRLNRNNHIQRLKDELEVTPVDTLEEQEANEWTVIKEKKILKKKMEEEALLKAKEIEMMSRLKSMEALLSDEETEVEEETSVASSVQQSQPFEDEYEEVEVEIQVPIDHDETGDFSNLENDNNSAIPKDVGRFSSIKSGISSITSFNSKDDVDSVALNEPPLVPAPGMKIVKVKRKVKKQSTNNNNTTSSSVRGTIGFSMRKMRKKKKDEKAIKEQQQRLQGQGFTFAERRTHYQKKLLSYDKKADLLQQEKMYIDKLRIENTSLMRRKEKILLSYQLEKERLKNYTGKSITSSVLTGADMQYKTQDYIDKLNSAFEIIITEIANIKYQIIENENRRLQITQDLVKNEDDKKERLAKYNEFESHYAKTMKIMHRLNLGRRNSFSGKDMGGGIVGGEQVENERILKLYFRKIYENKLHMKQLKQRIVIMFTNWLLRYKRNAFNRMKYGKFHINDEDSSLFNQSDKAEQEEELRQICSVGGVLLKKAMDKRMELQDELREVMSETSTIKQQLTLQKLSQRNVRKLKGNELFLTMEEGLNHHNLFHYQGVHILYEANAMAEENKFELAARLYEAQIISIRSKAARAYEQLPRQLKSKMFRGNILAGQDIKVLSICHGKLGQMFVKMGEIPRGIVEFDRQLSLAREINDKSEEADAFYGLGVGYFHNFDYENALRYLLIAQGYFLSNHRIQRYYNCLQSIKECYVKLHRDDKIAVYDEKLNKTEQTIHSKFKLMHEQLKDMQLRLAHTSAEIEHVVTIERTTFMAMEYKKFIKNKDEELEGLNQELSKQEAVIHKIEGLLDAIQKEMTEALETDELEMWSELVHETPQIVEIEELKQRLKQRIKVEMEELTLQRQVEAKILVKIRNVESEIEEKQQLLSLEEGNLMKHSRFDKPFRLIGLCLSNALGNEVTGTATGGYEEFAAAEGNNIHMIDYHNGELNHIFRGTSESAVLYNTGNSAENDQRGHTGVVTCLLHDGAMLFSGGTDEKIICWNTTTREKLRTLIGHEGSIVALAAENKYLVSSAADVTMRLWLKKTGQQVRVIFGHSKSVLTIEIGLKWMLTGSADFEVRVWKIEEVSRTKVDVESNLRLRGHECPVTCVRYGGVEALSGDAKGRVFIWWLKTGTILRKCEIHQGPIKCMQFDAVHIVTGSTDNAVSITDIASGEVLQTLRGHEKHVLALAFDSERILSVGGDNTLRYWAWGKKSGPQDKYHVLEPNQTLAMVSKQFQLPIDQLMRWNGIKNNRHIFTGMKLIVKKGDPNQLTDAEKVAQEREMRKNRGLALTNKKLATTNIELKNDELNRFSNKNLISDPKYARIHSLAMNMDYFSLGNRLFGNEKRKLELYPDHTMDDSDAYSLAARIELGIEEKADESIVGGQQVYLTDAPTSKASRRQKDFKSHLKKVRYYIAPENMDEWGEVSDSIGEVMLDMMIELSCYDIVLEQKRELRDKQSVIGRIFQYQNKKKTETTDAKKAKKHVSKVKWGKKKRKKRDGVDGGGSITASEESGSVFSGNEEYTTDEERGRDGGSDSENDEKMFHTILHSREEMKPIPEETEEDQDEPSRKRRVKQQVLDEQEAAITQYFDAMLEEEKKNLSSKATSSASPRSDDRQSFLPAISTREKVLESIKEEGDVATTSSKEAIHLPPIHK